MKPTKIFHALSLRKPSLLTTGALLAAGAFFTAPAQAQVPAAQVPSVVWQEDFSNIGATAVPLESYAGTGYSLGYSYTANDDWLPPPDSTFNGCNGWVLNSSSPLPTGAYADAGCSGNGGGGALVNNAGTVVIPATTVNAWTFLQRMAYALNQPPAAPPAAATSGGPGITGGVLASMTNGVTNQTTPVQFQTTDSAPAISLQAGHFYVISAWFLAVHCSKDGPGRGWADPVESLGLLNVPAGSSSIPVTPIASFLPCDTSTYYNDAPLITNGGPGVGRIYYSQAQAAFLADVDANVGMQISNTTKASTGNDVGIALPQIRDGTPQLYKSFDPLYPNDYRDGSIGVTNGLGTLTFVVVNTTDNLEKSGWSFTDNLPTNVIIASNPNVQTTCGASSVVSALAGGSTIAVTNGDLPAGAATCTISVDVTSGLIGVYPNDVADSSGNPGSVTMYALVPAVEETPGTPNPPAKLFVDRITLSKTAVVNAAAGAGGAVKPAVTAAGDVITYTFTLADTDPPGESELVFDSVVWNDPWPASGGFGFGGSSALPTIGNCTLVGSSPTLFLQPGDLLHAGQSLACTATYTVTQADIDAIILAGPTATFNNSATVTAALYPPGEVPAPGEPDNGTGVTLTTQPATVQTPVTQAPALTISKTASPTIMGAAGQVIAYTIVVTNTGNASLHGLTLDDNFDGHGTAPALDASCKLNNGGVAAALASFTLAPNDSVTCTANYTVTQDDITAGAVTNTANATGKTSSDTDVSTTVPGTATVNKAGIALNKTAAVTGGTPSAAKSAVTAAGDVITYTFTLNNPGNGDLRLSTVAWTDPQPPVGGIGFTGSSALSIDNCTVDGSATLPNALTVGKSLVCTATYTVTQGDIDAAIAGAGTIDNTASVNVMAYPVGETPAPGDPDTAAGISLTAQSSATTATATVTQNPALTITKTANPTRMNAAGDVIAYTITLRNTGNETLDNLVLTDTFSGMGTEPAIKDNCTLNGSGTSAALTSFTLLPGDFVTCTANYTVVQADITARTLTNTASATSRNRHNTEVDTSKMTATVMTASAMAPIPALDARGLALLVIMLGALVFRQTRRARRR